MSKDWNSRETLNSTWNRNSHRVKVPKNFWPLKFTVFATIQERLMGNTKMLKHFKRFLFYTK